MRFFVTIIYNSNRQISRYIDTREIMEVAEHNGKF